MSFDNPNVGIFDFEKRLLNQKLMQLLEGLNGPALIIEDGIIGQDNLPKKNILMFNTHFSEVFQMLKVKLRNVFDLPIF